MMIAVEGIVESQAARRASDTEGIIVFAVAILPLLDVGGSQLFRAETPGPMKDAKLTPRIAETAKRPVVRCTSSGGSS